MDSLEGIQQAFELGCYSTYITRQKSSKWSTAAASTLGDYVTICEGDSVFFFSDRNIYGIGKVVKLDNAKDCFIETFPGATFPENFPCSDTAKHIMPNTTIKRMAQYGSGHIYRDQRWMLAFKPAPKFFRTCIDTDDLLMSDSASFKSIRVNEGRSFIKMDDDETQALTSALIQRNKIHINSSNPDVFYSTKYQEVHGSISKKLELDDYEPKIAGLLTKSRKKNGSLGQEMLLEAGFLYQMTSQEPGTINTFGIWDYIAHQIPGSPFKPIQYMDRIDVFGYRQIPGFEHIVDTFFIAELKKDSARPEDIHQIMKYVDWIRDEYAAGNYNLISAYLIAKRIPKSLFQELDSVVRQFTIGSRPARTGKWDNLHLAEYSVDEHGVISFNEVSLT